MQHSYFAASNSSEGFKNYFPQIFGSSDRIYIIKGGPGTGKSGFMKQCAKHAVKQGYQVERYYCSSDPESLDGLIIKCDKETISIVDGTAPHLYEIEIPGARDDIIDLGQFWNSSILRKEKNEILSLNVKKSAAYKRAYDYLRSCGNLRAVTDSLLRRAIEYEKMEQAAERMVRSFAFNDGKAVTVPSVLGAVSMMGGFRFDSFEKNAKCCYRIGDLYGVGQIYLDTVFSLLSQKTIDIRVSYDPINCRHCDGLFIAQKKIALLIDDKERDSCDTDERYINSRRFIKPERLRTVRGELRYAGKLYRDCYDGALHALSEAKVYHFLLEDIYKNAMDFAALTEFTKRFVEDSIH